MRAGQIREQNRAIWAVTAAVAACAVGLSSGSPYPTVADPPNLALFGCLAVSLGVTAGVPRGRAGGGAPPPGSRRLHVLADGGSARARAVLRLGPDLLLWCRLAGAVLAYVWPAQDSPEGGVQLRHVRLGDCRRRSAICQGSAVLGDHDRLSPRAFGSRPSSSVLFTSALGSTLVSTVITISTGQRPRTAGRCVQAWVSSGTWRTRPALSWPSTSSPRTGARPGCSFWCSRPCWSSPTAPTKVRANARRASSRSTASPSSWGGRSSSTAGSVHRVMDETRAAFDVEVVQLRLPETGPASRPVTGCWRDEVAVLYQAPLTRRPAPPGTVLEADALLTARVSPGRPSRPSWPSWPGCPRLSRRAAAQ